MTQPIPTFNSWWELNNRSLPVHDPYELARAVAERFTQPNAPQPEAVSGGWIEVSPETMPKSGWRVLVVLLRESGRRIRTVAQYVASFSELADLDFADESQCDEKDGDLYVKPGWYEWPVEAEENYRLGGTVTHWQLMPELPCAQKGGAL